MPREALSIIVFPGGTNWPIWVAQSLGLFGRHGLEVSLHYTTSSMEQLAGLIQGRWNIGMTGFDNVVAYQEGQGEAKIDRAPDLFVFMGGDDAFLRLVVQRDITGYADLKGRRLAVDALTTGFAFVLRKMLARNGLAPGDVELVRAGGVLQRWEALKAGEYAGTLLLTPFEILAEAAGLRLLQNASEVLPDYQGLAGTARRGWARANRPQLVAYIRAYLEALTWLYERSNRAESVRILLANMPHMTANLAERTYDVLLAETTGLDRRARLDRKGIATVLALRSEYGEPRKRLDDVTAYDDLSYYEEAVA
jgi:ABC-type nitrate/sulfonate/bicarbonate transport system substrate-binding protein